MFSMVDKLHVPADLPAGDYSLSWRWDCEQTPQVWNSCSDVTVEAGAGAGAFEDSIQIDR